MNLLFFMEHLYPIIGGAERSVDSLIQALRAYPDVNTNYVCYLSIAEDKVDADAMVKEADVVITQGNWADSVIRLAAFHHKKSVLFVRSYESLCDKVQDAKHISHCGQQCRGCAHRKTFPLVPDLTLTNSNYMANMLQQEHSIKSEVIYPFIDTKEVLATPRKRRFITMNQFAYHKGTDLFLEIARAMPEYEFRVVGYQCWKSEAEIPPNVEVTGMCDPLDFYGDTLIFLAPARWNEPFGRTLIESRMNAIPTITSARGGALEDHLVHEELLVDDIENIDAWINKIRLVLDSYNSFSQAQKMADISDYLIDKNVEKFYASMLRLSAERIKKTSSNEPCPAEA